MNRKDKDKHTKKRISLKHKTISQLAIRIQLSCLKMQTTTENITNRNDNNHIHWSANTEIINVIKRRENSPETFLLKDRRLTI